MNVIVFNCGSSSLKYRIIDMPSGKELAGGEAQRVSPKTAEPSRIIHRENGKEETIYVNMPNHAEAFRQVNKVLDRNPNLKPEIIGHRLVHGGSIFKDCAIINDKAVADLESIQDMAPIHNPPAIALIRACVKIVPDLPQVAVFDTAYHSTMPEYAYSYALPKILRDDYGVRKYGFHGTSHHYVVNEAAAFLNKPIEKFNAVSCHLGSGGASLCAVVNGKSMDNTMGYSPLQGLVMSTRCGDLDPALTMNLLAMSNGDHKSVENRLNKSSGVLGMSGISSDIRDVLQKKNNNEASDKLALTVNVYTWRIKKYLGSYLAVVKNADAVIFTDTIGELVPEIRQAVCADMSYFGLEIDNEINANAKTLPCDVSAKNSKVRALVIATNEEISIARQTYNSFMSKN